MDAYVISTIISCAGSVVHLYRSFDQFQFPNKHVYTNFVSTIVFSVINKEIEVVKAIYYLNASDIV